MSPNQSADDEAEYQSLLAKRVRLLQNEKRLRQDIARIQEPQTQAEQRYAQMASLRLRELQEQRTLMREQVAVQRQVRETDLRQRYGNRLGGFLAGAERVGQSRIGQTLGAGVTAFGAFAGNAARSGFSGTVEGNRLAFEWQMLNREFASAFKPVIELFTSGVQRVRKFMEGLDGSGQRLVMIAGLLAGAYGTLRVARTVGGALGLAGGLAGGGGGLGSLVGLGGAALAARGGTAAAGSAGGVGAAATAATGATAVGAAKGGGAIAGAARFGVYAAPAFDALRGYDIGGTALRGIRAKTDEERMGAAGDLLRDIKQNGGLASGLGFDRLLLGSGYGKRKMAEAGIDADKPGAKKPRDQVTPDQFGYESVGEAYKRASISFLSKTPDESKPAEQKEGADVAGVAIEKGFDKLMGFLQEQVMRMFRPDVK